jgi:hypothetical protein
LSAHMSRKSWRLAGMSMSIETDAKGGRAIGSHMWLHGAMPGVSLAVECVVVGRRAPKFKEWENRWHAPTAGTRPIPHGSANRSSQCTFHGHDCDPTTRCPQKAGSACSHTRWVGSTLVGAYGKWRVIS